MKRFMDFVICIFLLLMLFPFIITISILIRIKLGSPIFFMQMRSGKDGEPFKIYKFRTMNNLSHINGRLLSKEERLTSFGLFLRKYSLDELPQLINVIRGEISFVGPRPLLLDYVELYSKEQRKRLKVKPGITGWAQINGRNAITWEERFSLDIWYVENQSLFLDFKIIFITIKKFLGFRKISDSGDILMPRFTGDKINERI